MKKHLITLATVLIALAAAPASFAGKHDKEGGIAGKVSAVANGSVTITNKKEGDRILKTDASTKVTKLDGTAGALSDITAGAHVRVKAGTAPDQAAEIRIVEHKKKGAAPAQ